MTYNKRPLYGIKESFFGPAAYAEVQYQQKINPQPVQAMSVGNSNTNPTIEGFEKTIYPLKGVKRELMGAAIVSQAQAIQGWEDLDRNTYTVVEFESTITYSPIYETNKYYVKNGDDYVKLTTAAPPANWGIGDFYISDEALEPTYTKVVFTENISFTPEYEADTYYIKVKGRYNLLTEKDVPTNWGTADMFYTQDEEE